MSLDEFIDFKAAFCEELELWPPSEQSFDVSLSKTKMHFRNPNIRLSSEQKEVLKKLYLEAKMEELQRKRHV